MSRRRFLLSTGVALSATLLGPRLALGAESWVQNFQETDLYLAPKGGKGVVRLPQWTFLRVVGPAEQQRLPVEHPASRERVYVDVSAVGPSNPPPAGWTYAAVKPPAATPTPSAPRWLAPFAPTALWTASTDGILLGEADRGTYFEALETQRGARVKVRDPLTNGTLYLNVKTVGPVGAPPSAKWVPTRWWGYVGTDGINVRSEPSGDSPLVGTLALGTPVVVEAWVSGQEVIGDQPTWAMLGDGYYVYSPLLRKAQIDLPPPMPSHGPLADQWIDVNLTQQTVTAYEGDRPIYMTFASSGRPAWETREGIHRIIYRKENETMESNRLLAADAARSRYRVENVRWTQYFTSDGQAIHENYWRDPELFGIPASHGCLGMSGQDALWFWLWAAPGVPISIHG